MEIHKVDNAQRYYIRKGGNVVDLIWKAEMLQNLSNLGMGRKYLSYKEIMDVMGYSDKNNRRLELLKLQEWLTHKRTKAHSRRFIYTFSSKSLAYLREYGSFSNPDGWMMKKLEKIRYVEKEKPKHIEEEKPEPIYIKEKEIEFGEDTNLEYDNTRRESW